jgi:hypothetical protein
MPDLPGRKKYEDELATALVLAWEPAKLDVADGKEPDWAGLEASIAQETDETLSAAAIAAALLMMFDLSGTRRLPDQFGVDTGQAGSLAQGLVKSRRDAWSDDVLPDVYIDRWFSDYAAESIGITEVTGAISLGEAMLHAELLAQGVEVVAVWNIDPRSNVCPICLNLNGRTESYWEADYPNGPPAHPRCACFKTYHPI